jgi:hypothetical protein
MIRIPGKGIRYGEIWFDEAPEAPLPDILICRQRSQPWPSGQCEDFHTLLVDLTQDEDTLFNSFGKDNRYKIRRAATKDIGASAFLDQPSGELDAFCRFYDQFASAKGVARVYRKWLDQAASAGKLILTRAGQGAEVHVWHAYVVSDGRARLLYSASLFREQDKILQAVIGRLNRWLHWQDMLEFKRRGFRIYDFGGLFSDESSAMAAGINRFKEEFGGLKSRDYDCTAALTWKGRIYLTLLNLRNRYRKAKVQG